MALTANRELNRYVDQELRTFPVKASEHIWKGALVGIDRGSGDVRNLVAGDVFAGVAYEEADNSSGSGGDISVRLYTQGDFVMQTLNVTADHVGSPMYATDNEVTNVAPTGLGASYCGILMAVLSSNTGIVRIVPMAIPQNERALQVPLSSSTSGATTNPVMIAQRTIKILSIEVLFNTVPDQGNLDVGTHASDPDETVDAFDLSGLTANTPTSLTIVSNQLAKGSRLWAKVGQASSTAGVGGLLSIRYVELP
ncbi:MAG: hypothetical protein JXQ75_06990 [Phycisphaerae bacterium]|nr:hypothetical protein [Phycisphaerae bacterium]